MNFKGNESEQKLRGGYYTPPDLALFLSQWIAVKQPRNVLEPSCGDGAFFDALGSSSTHAMSIRAFEVCLEEAEKAKTRANKQQFEAHVSASDFLSWAGKEIRKTTQSFDAVIGNPPFIRYQYLPKKFQERAECIFDHLDCHFTKHTNAWVPFVLASIALLKPGGRLGMVLPAELIHVTHAQSLRAYLKSTCRRVVVIYPEKLWFTDTLQGAVLLLAEKKQSSCENTCELGVLPVKDREFTAHHPEKVFSSVTTIDPKTIGSKWTGAMLDRKTLESLNTAAEKPGVHRFAEIAQVDVGIVTGANKFFLVPNTIVKQYALQEHAYPMFGRSEHCPGVVYDARQHEENSQIGKPTNFIWFKDGDVTRNRTVRDYIQYGELQNLHQRYKCRIRSPWYCVPSVYATDIGMLKRSHHVPKLILNRARAFTTDTAYRIKCQSVEPDVLVAGFLNPLTALSAELEGRHYGGGVLELVPSEIEKLMVVTPTGMDSNLSALDKAVRAHTAEEVLIEHGQKVLSNIGLTKEMQHTFLDAWIALRNRRLRVSA